MRRGQHELLRVPDAAVVRPLAQEGRVHGDEPRQQPRLRLRPAGLRRRLAALCGVGLANGPAGPGQVTVQKAGPSGRDRRVRAVPVGAVADGHRRPRSGSSGRRPRGPTSSSSRCTPAPRARTSSTSPGEPRCSSARTAATRGRFAHAVVDAGADLVVGHGPHVLRGMEWYSGRLIAYSLGNFAGYKVFALGGPLSIERHPARDAPGDGSVRDRQARPDPPRRRRLPGDRPVRGRARRRPSSPGRTSALAR